MQPPSEQTIKSLCSTWLSDEEKDNIATLNWSFKKRLPKNNRFVELVRVVRELISCVLRVAVPDEHRGQLFRAILRTKWPGVLDKDEDEHTNNVTLNVLAKSYKVALIPP